VASPSLPTGPRPAACAGPHTYEVCTESQHHPKQVSRRALRWATSTFDGIIAARFGDSLATIHLRISYNTIPVVTTRPEGSARPPIIARKTPLGASLHHFLLLLERRLAFQDHGEPQLIDLRRLRVIQRLALNTSVCAVRTNTRPEGRVNIMQGRLAKGQMLTEPCPGMSRIKGL
jgi:hypothetical protein